MAIVASANAGSLIPTHPDGQFAAICIDVVDRGVIETHWKGAVKKKHKVTVRFFCGEWGEIDDEHGKKKSVPLWVDAWFTLSLSDKGNLRPFLESWRGKKFTEQELKGFDLESLIDKPAYLQLSHNITPNQTYVNIDSVMRLPKGVEAIGAPEGYVRVADRPNDDNERAANVRRPFEDDDDLPF
jgi:hypothetical protein